MFWPKTRPRALRIWNQRCKTHPRASSNMGSRLCGFWEVRMRINFHGAAHTVTGSQHLLEINGHRLLLDCGLYQGQRSETYARNLNFVYDPRSVDAVILSHAHIDHCGNLPNLVRRG